MLFSDPMGTFFELFYGGFEKPCKYRCLVANYCGPFLCIVNCELENVCVKIELVDYWLHCDINPKVRIRITGNHISIYVHELIAIIMESVIILCFLILIILDIDN